MNSLSTSGYKGTRDYYPEDKRIQNYIFSTWSRIAQRHGYQEYGAPLLEPLEIYTAKSGQELATEQTYAFTDRAERTVAIRPEMTPSVSRMVAARRQELGYPARLFSIANFMRYERPQRGREREFWQMNVDMFGADGVIADAEIIEMAAEIMKAFGAKSSMYEIRINDRHFISAILTEYLFLDAVSSQKMMKLFDRMNKISEEDFRQTVAEIFQNESVDDVIQKIKLLVSAKNIEDLPEILKNNPAAVNLKELLSQLSQAGVSNARFDATLMRGLDYYTGMVFEVFDLHPDNNRSMFGGGRYDGLVALFGAEAIPTVGMAPGLSTTELFLHSHNLLPELLSTTELGIVVIDDVINDALQLARNLRKEGVNVEVDITGRKIDKQIKSFVKKQIPYLLFVGSNELSDGQYTLKNARTAEEEKMSIERLISKVKDRRQATEEFDDEIYI